MARFHLLVSGASLIASVAQAETTVIGEVALSSTVIDRGGHIAGPAFEAALILESDIGNGTLYGGVYRLTPLGADQGAFPDETDYTIGYAFAGEGFTADVSASWLTYPGEGEEASLELAGEVVFAVPLNPVIAGFYDAEFEDYGMEMAIRPEWTAGEWTHYAVGRAGFVAPGVGSANRSYAGAEIGTVRALSDAAEIGAYARYEIADEDSFADTISNGAIATFTSSGLAVGIVAAVGF